jgi:hypothetical protein
MVNRDEMMSNVNTGQSGWEAAENWKQELYKLQQTFDELKKQFNELSRINGEQNLIISVLAGAIQRMRSDG